MKLVPLYDLRDAPAWLDADEAYAWLAGYNAAVAVANANDEEAVEDKE